MSWRHGTWGALGMECGWPDCKGPGLQVRGCPGHWVLDRGTRGDVGGLRSSSEIHLSSVSLLFSHLLFSSSPSLSQSTKLPDTPRQGHETNNRAFRSPNDTLCLIPLTSSPSRATHDTKFQPPLLASSSSSFRHNHHHLLPVNTRPVITPTGLFVRPSSSSPFIAARSNTEISKAGEGTTVLYSSCGMSEDGRGGPNLCVWCGQSPRDPRELRDT